MAVKNFDKAASLSNATTDYAIWQSRTLGNLTLLLTDQRRMKAATESSTQSVDVARRVFTEFPKDVTAKEALGAALTNHGEVLPVREMFEDAEAVFREAYQHYAWLANRIPDYSEYPWSRAMSQSNIALSMLNQTNQDLTEIESLLTDAKATYDELDKQMPDNPSLLAYITANNQRISQLTKLQKHNRNSKLTVR